MSVRERIAAIRLADKIEKNRVYADRIGVFVTGGRLKCSNKEKKEKNVLANRITGGMKYEEENDGINLVDGFVGGSISDGSTCFGRGKQDDHKVGNY